MLMAASTEDYGKARAMATDAVQSRAYLYPIKVQYKQYLMHYHGSFPIATDPAVNTIGHLLLHRPPQLMAAVARPSCSLWHAHSLCDWRHVCHYLPSSARCHGAFQRPISSVLDSPPHAE